MPLILAKTRTTPTHSLTVPIITMVFQRASIERLAVSCWLMQGRSLRPVSPITKKVIQLGYGFDGTKVYGPICFRDVILPGGPAGEDGWWTPKSSWVLRVGNRQMDNGPEAPPGEYNGKYVQDYEFDATKGNLDMANGHVSKISADSEGTYHYHLTVEFPAIPRYYRKRASPVEGSTPLAPR